MVGGRVWVELVGGKELAELGWGWGGEEFGMKELAGLAGGGSVEGVIKVGSRAVDEGVSRTCWGGECGRK